MLVQCPECTTKYNLDESKIGHDGSKVRCTRCKNVFTVFRPIENDEPEAVPQAVPSARGAGEEPFRDDFASSFKEGQKNDSAPRQPVDSFEDDLEALFRDNEVVPASTKSSPSRNSAEADSFEDDLAAMLDEKKPAASSISSASASFEDDLTALMEEKQSRTSSKASADEEMIADLQGAFQQPLTDQLDHDPAPGRRSPSTSKKTGSMGLIIGLVVLLLASAVAGVYFLKPGLLGLGPTVPGAPATAPDAVVREGAAQIALENVRQYFVPNEKEGQLFIIEGKAVNRFPEARELIRIKASLFDRQGGEVATQEFMCGNVVSLYQLQVSARADIEAALTAKVGILTNNTNIQPGASVPFMAVFFKTPDSVEEFGLEVIQSSVPQQ
jgi:predicted Zn finger-like uncharacterized protein